MTAGNVASIIAAACVTYLPTSQQWNRLVAFWFTGFQAIGFSLSLAMISSNVRFGVTSQESLNMDFVATQVGGFTKKTVTTAVTFVGVRLQCRIPFVLNVHPQIVVLHWEYCRVRASIG